MDDFRLMWDFPILEGVDFPKANRVHPLMQRRVQKLLQGLREDPNIRQVVLFGSALDFRCNSRSDIDLYVEKYETEKALASQPELDCEVDILTNLSPDTRLYREIYRTGLLLFQRGEEYV